VRIVRNREPASVRGTRRPSTTRATPTTVALFAMSAALMSAPSAAALLFASPVTAQQPSTAAATDPGFELTIENIMRGPEHVGQSPSGVRWSDDGRWIYFRWLPGGAEWDASSSLYRVAAAGGTPQ
jgi:hypothetical protein